MAKKYLDYDGLLYFWQKIKANFVTDVTYNSTSRKIQRTKAGSTGDVVTLSKVATSNSYSDLDNKPTIPEAVQPTTTTPKMDGTASVGSETKYAKGDHVHPSDISRVPTTRTVNGKALSSDITLDADDIGIDDFTGATSSAAGTHGLVPAPASEDRAHVLIGNGDWARLVIEDYEGRTVVYSASVGSDELEVKLFYATSHRGGLMSPGDKTKLSGIEAGAEVNVQADWNEADSTSDAYITNKPTLGTAAAKGVVTTISSDSADLPTTTAVKNYVATAITGAAAFQGTAPTSFAPTNYKKGYYWVVGTAGTYVGEACEAGDMIFAVEDYASAYSASDFNVIQTNLDITSITNGEIDTIVAS